jgi:threonine dehydratase
MVEVMLVGKNFDEAKVAAEKFRIDNNLTFIDPFDDKTIIT